MKRKPAFGVHFIDMHAEGQEQSWRRLHHPNRDDIAGDRRLLITAYLPNLPATRIMCLRIQSPSTIGCCGCNIQLMQQFAFHQRKVAAQFSPKGGCAFEIQQGTNNSVSV